MPQRGFGGKPAPGQGLGRFALARLVTVVYSRPSPTAPDPNRDPQNSRTRGTRPRIVGGGTSAEGAGRAGSAGEVSEHGCATGRPCFLDAVVTMPVTGMVPSSDDEIQCGGTPVGLSATRGAGGGFNKMICE